MRRLAAPLFDADFVNITLISVNNFYVKYF